MNDAGTAKVIEQARAAMQRRDVAGALHILQQAEQQGASPELFLEKALALRMSGDLTAAVIALDNALILDPVNFLALLSKGALMERLGRDGDAAVIYKNALAVAPPDGALPAGLAAPVARAREVVKAQAEALTEHLRSSLAALRERFAGEALDRFDESLEIFTGRKRAYVQEPLLLHYPRLPAIPFYERDLFPWLETLEAATPVIQEELAIALSARADDFTPYIAFPPGAPVNQWGELNHSRRWNSFFLWRDGARQDEACALCPQTAALLSTLPMADQSGFAPTAVFSVLEPHTHIPPHTGSANTRLLVHLPLVLPGPARFRVGNVTRPWRMGEAWVFDDTIEHEAWNDADQPRAILIFDIWNPLLSQAERELISAMMTAKTEFQSGRPAPSLSTTPNAYPVTLDPKTDQVRVVQLSEAAYHDASFLDERILEQTGPGDWRPWTAFESAARDLNGESDFIFHMGHVGSTLVARLLGESERVLSLREPAILRTLATSDAVLERYLKPLLRLYARVYRPGQRSLIKATSFVSEIAGPMMDASPSAKAILMVVPPMTYLSTILSGPTSRAGLRSDAPQRLARLQRRLNARPWTAADMSEGELAAMGWACEACALTDIAARFPDRALWLDFDAFLANPAGGLSALLRHLHGEARPEVVETMLKSPHLTRYSKAPEHPYDPELRRRVLAEGQTQHRAEIERGMAWLNAAANAHAPIAHAIQSIGATSKHSAA